MSTELQRQIDSQLRVNELAYLARRSLAVNFKKKGRVSFLFDGESTKFHASGGLSSENKLPIYEDLARLRLLAEQGLSELESLNQKMTFESFTELLEVAEVSSVGMLTRREAFERLERLKRFIDFLVPYFLFDSAKICIEYLIQAYDIHVLLGEYIFYSFLPYHDMPEFVQLIKTLDVPNTSEIKGLVDAIKGTKTTISSRGQLSGILLKNPTLFKNLVSFWERSLGDFHLTKNNALINLVSWLTIEILEDLSGSKDARFSESYFESIIEVIIFGTSLKGSRFEELRSMGYCIIYKLATPLFRLSFETQTRLVEELFRAIIRDFGIGSNPVIGYVPETLLLVNHILVQFGLLGRLHHLDSDIAIFMVKNRYIFTGAFEQLAIWSSDVLEVLTLITKSVLYLGFSLDSGYLDSCLEFIGDILKSICGTDSALMIDSRQSSNIIKTLVLSLIDFYSQDKENHFEGIIQTLRLNYPSEFVSALSYSLGLSSSS